MRKLPIQLPDTGQLNGPVLGYAQNLNLELDGFNRDLNKYIGRLVHSSLTEDGTLTADNEVVLCNGTFTVTLSPAASSDGKRYYIKNIGTGTITVDGDESETIDGETSVELDQYEYMDIVSDGESWWMI